MGTEEAKKQLAEDDQLIDVNPDELEESDGSEEEASPETDGQEVEIVLAGEDGSQPAKNPRGFKRRVNKLNERVQAANERTDEVSRELEIERQKNKILELALSQGKEDESGPPDPNEFDEGAADPKYRKALNDYTTSIVQQELEKAKPAEPTPAPVPTVNPELQEKQSAHYERAEKLPVKDYEAVEDVAIDILGKENVNHIINNIPNSELLMFHLGKNPDKAREIVDTIKTNPIAGVLELGNLSARLQVKPAGNREPVPSPDEELEGTGAQPTTKRRGPPGATYE